MRHLCVASAGDSALSKTSTHSTASYLQAICSAVSPCKFTDRVVTMRHAYDASMQKRQLALMTLGAIVMADSILVSLSKLELVHLRRNDAVASSCIAGQQVRGHITFLLQAFTSAPAFRSSSTHNGEACTCRSTCCTGCKCHATYTHIHTSNSRGKKLLVMGTGDIIPGCSRSTVLC